MFVRFGPSEHYYTYLTITTINPDASFFNATIRTTNIVKQFNESFKTTIFPEL